MNDDPRKVLQSLWIFSGGLMVLFCALAFLSGLVVWLWFLTSHPTTERMESSVASLIEKHSEPLPDVEATHLSSALSQCALIRMEYYQAPFKPRVTELYGLFGFKDADEHLIQATAEAIVDYCGKEYLNGLDSIAEIRARVNLLDRAGLKFVRATIYNNS